MQTYYQTIEFLYDQLNDIKLRKFVFDTKNNRKFLKKLFTNLHFYVKI